jgi:hypothetical protein
MLQATIASPAANTKSIITINKIMAKIGKINKLILPILLCCPDITSKMPLLILPARLD